MSRSMRSSGARPVDGRLDGFSVPPFVVAASRLAADVAGGDEFRGAARHGKSESRRKDLSDVRGDVEAHRVRKLDRSHRHAELDGRTIDERKRHALVRGEHGFGHVRHQDAIHDETRRAAAGQGKLVEASREGERILDNLAARLGRPDDLDEHHLCNRVEEVQADEAARIRESACEFLEDDARRVGGEDGALLHARLELCIELALRVRILEDRLDDDVCAWHACAFDVRRESRRHLGRLRRIAGTLAEELARAGKRRLDVLHLAVL